MQTNPYFADVIVPLALQGMLTYSIPETLELKEGDLVLVPLGQRKQMTALVYRIHQNPPPSGKTKPIIQIQGPGIANPQTLKFWSWIWTYYMCNPGEVISAALPGRIKLHSESLAVFSPLAKKNFSALENTAEQQIMASLREAGQMKLADIQKRFPTNFNRVIRKLIDNEFVILKESVHEPDPQFFYEVIQAKENWEEVMDKILSGKRAPKQQEAAVKLYDLLQNTQQPHHLKETMRNLGISRTIIKELVKKGLIEIHEIERGRLLENTQTENVYPLSEAQQKALSSIREGFKNQRVQFLHGVTSSGKTEIYSHLIKETINQGKQCLLLLPEIALTTQLIGRIRKFFGEKVAVYHSRVTEKERSDVWESVRQNLEGASIVIGARSAIFLPFHDLGLVIVDEEHDGSYKQTDPAPRYQGRDAAIVLAKLFQANMLLGSATPALETFHNCIEKRYDYIPLTERYQQIKLPNIELVDFGWERKKKLVREDFSLYLLEGIKQELEKKRQVIIFHNRRGYAPITQCRDCGETPMCINCDISLTYHKHSHSMRCHLCGYREQVEGACTKCGSMDLQMRGAGTEKIVDQLQEFFPDVSIDRLDWDSTRKKDSFEQVIERFELGETDILVGTQMVTKGLDFKHVGLVGIIHADLMMNIPEIRATERTYQLSMQVAGRAGRFGEQGKVIIQTYQPDSAVIQAVASGRQKSFYQSELAERKDFSYPPFSKMIRVCMRHRDWNVLQHTANSFRPVLEHEPYLSMLGPEPPLISRAKNQYRMDILIKLNKDSNYPKLKKRLQILTQHFFAQKPHNQVRIYFDVDPM